MTDEIELWRIKAEGKEGTFGAFSVQGHPYERNDGEGAWHISTWSDGPASCYWVRHQRFYRVMIHAGDLGGNRIEIYGEVENLADSEKEAVLDAIKKWEGEPSPKGRA